MAAFLRSRFVRAARLIFRWCRIAVLLAVLLVVAAVVYLSTIGLPDFAKEQLLKKLRENGIAVQFANARLGLGQEIIIENPAFGRPGQPLAPELSARRTEVGFDIRDLLQSHWRLHSLRIIQGQVRLPIAESGNKALSLNDCDLLLEFLPSDTVRLEKGSANFLGARINVTGSVTNFSALRDWPVFQSHGSNQNWQANLQRFAETAEKIHFDKPPELALKLSADGRNLDTLKAFLYVAASGAQTPWGEVKHLKLTVDCAKIFNPGPQPFTRLQLAAGEIRTPWGKGEKISLTAAISRHAGNAGLLDGQLEFSVSKAGVSWPPNPSSNLVQAAEARWNGALTVDQTNFVPLAAKGQLRLSRAESRWGTVRQIDARVSASRIDPPPAAEAAWGPWAAFAPYQLNYEANASGVDSPKLQLGKVFCSGQWRAPELSVRKLDLRLYDGCLQASARLSLGSRVLQAKVSSDFDPRKIAPLLTEVGKNFIGQFSWKNPPKIQSTVQLTLPAWTNRQPDWKGEVLPTLRLAGEFSFGEGAFRKIATQSAQSSFTYSNRIWDLPRIHVTRPGEELYLGYTGNEVTHQYRFVFDSDICPKTIRPLLEHPQQQALLDKLEFPVPPKVHGEISGFWRQRSRITFKGNLSATDFLICGQKMDRLSGSLEGTNQALKVSDVRLSQGNHVLNVPLVQADFNEKSVTISNAFSTLDLKAIFGALGPKTPAFLEQMEFATPPTILLAGSFSTTNPAAMDLHFDIAGDHFRWTNLLVDRISGRIDWVGRCVTLTNVQASLYGNGSALGWAVFDYRPQLGTDCRFKLAVSDIDLPLAVYSFARKTNRLEGKLDLQIEAQGFSHDKHSWQGKGSAHLRDGLLWDIPIFGLFSPLLNAISPGTGNSKAREADATFTLNNGSLCTHDLEIRATGFRLLYRGCIDADRQIDARVEAKMLRDAWAVGPVLSMALTPLSKMFEYQVTGPVNHPSVRPVYFPKFLLSLPLFHPIHALKHLLPKNSEGEPPQPLAPVYTSPSEPAKQQ